ncbi:MAG: WD40/YVTN/BNR-like repeat-containing protein [Candidatus Kapaibacterium sp.]
MKKRMERKGHEVLRTIHAGLVMFFLFTSGVEAADWTLLSTGRNDIYYDCSFVDAKTGWIIGASDVGSKGVVLKTTDGGLTWMRQESDSLGSYTSIHRVSRLELWIAGSNGALLHTTDGGSNWTPVPSGVKSTFSRITFRSATHGFAAGSGGVVIRTTDGGTTWSECTNIRTVDSLAGQVNNLFCEGNDVYVASFNTMIRSSDNGASWTVVSTLPANGTIHRTINLGSRILCVTREGSTYVSTDEYRTWTRQTSLGFSACGQYFRDASNGWVCGSKGSIVTTTDGGGTWNTAYTGLGSRVLWSVSPADSVTMYCVGTVGTVLRSSLTTTSVNDATDCAAPSMNPAAIVMPDDGYVPMTTFSGEDAVDVVAVNGDLVLRTPALQPVYLGHLTPGVYALRAGIKRMLVVVK